MARFKLSSGARLEKAAFFVALLIGGGAIIALRSWGVFGASDGAVIASVHWTAWAAIAVAIVTIAGYGFYAWCIPHSDISLDQAADNAYYLGLLFTLFSLVFALLQVQNLLDNIGDGDPQRQRLVLDLLPDFGLALVSTIAGIIARVVLQQFRSGIEEAEERARTELTRATAEFRDKLFVAVGDFANAARAATDAVNDIKSHLQTTLKAAADSTAEAVREAGTKVNRANAEFAAGAATATQQMQDFAEQSGKAVKKLHAQSETTIDDWRKQQTAAMKALGQQSAESLNKLVARGGELMEQVQAQSKAAAERLREQTARADADSARTGENLTALGDHAATAQTKVAELAEASEAFTKTLGELTRTMQDAVNRAAEQAAAEAKRDAARKRKRGWRFWRRH